MADIMVPDKVTLDIACQKLDLPELSMQESRFLLAKFRGLNTRVASRSAGLEYHKALAFEESNHYQPLYHYLFEHSSKTSGVTRDRLNIMLFDAHDLAATSGERISAVRELGQLNDLYPQKQAPQVNVQINNAATIQNEKEVQRLSDDELMALAGMTPLEPEADGPE